jgi:hypothetical protein
MKNYKEMWIQSCKNCYYSKKHQDGCLECSLSDFEPVSCFGICDLFHQIYSVESLDKPITKRIVEIDCSVNGEFVYATIEDEVSKKKYQVHYRLHEDMSLTIIKKELDPLAFLTK